MRVAILLFCCAAALGQDTSPAPGTKPQGTASSSDQKQQLSETNPNNKSNKDVGTISDSAIQQAAKEAAVRHGRDFGLGTGVKGQQLGGLDILSDTQGVDFGPYIAAIKQDVRENWYHLIPKSAEMRKGKLAIEFAITKNGQLEDMRLVATSGDVALDRPAWGAITASNPFPPLPSEFAGPYLALRFRFYYNPTSGETSENSHEISRAHKSQGLTNVIVVINSASDGLRVPVGGTEAVGFSVTGATDSSVEWIISGLGCSGSACGKMNGNVYVAPSARPDPPYVTLTAVSKADLTAKDSAIVHIVEPASKTASKP
jgi:TonB family protein